MPDTRGDVTALLAELRLGRKDALERLMPLVYGELRRIAAHQMRAERAGHTLSPTALAHEAFLLLVDQSHASWHNRAQFLSVAAQLMRRLLVDYARRRRASKRGIAITLDEEIFPRTIGASQIEEIDQTSTMEPCISVGTRFASTTRDQQACRAAPRGRRLQAEIAACSWPRNDPQGLEAFAAA